jgi:hypothetical protein
MHYADVGAVRAILDITDETFRTVRLERFPACTLKRGGGFLTAHSSGP